MGIVGLLSFWSTIMTVSVAEPASRGLPLSVAVTTSLWVRREGDNPNCPLLLHFGAT